MQYSIEAKEYGTYDVVVCGAGTAGVCAAIAAARQGAKTLLIERTFTVGGMLTLGDGGITKFTEHCDDVDKYKKEVLDVLSTNPKSVQVVGGIAEEYVKRLIDKGTGMGTGKNAGSYVFTDRIDAQWTLIDMLREAGVEVLYDTRVCLANMDGDALQSIVVCNKEGFLEIKAKRFIDTTGDADLAALAGVDFHFGASQADVDMGGAVAVGQTQHVGTMYRVRDVDYHALFDWLEANPDRFVQHEFGVMSLENVRKSYDEGEMCVFRFLMDTPVGDGKTELLPVQVYNLPIKDEAILLGKMNAVHNVDGLNAKDISRSQDALQVGVRAMNEVLRNQIPGFENVKAVFIPDVGIRETRHIIGEYSLTAVDVLTGRDFEDSIGCGGHPIDIHPLPPEVEDMEMNHWRFHIPYGIMVPKKIENLLVAGRSVSGERVAIGAIRPTAQCMVMGEAAGVAAAISIEDNSTCRKVDVKKLRDTLIKGGAIL